MNLRKIFKNDVSSSAFNMIDGEIRITGKWGQISIISDYFDIWFIQPDLQPLSHQKLTAIRKNFPVDGELRILNGEAYTQTRDEASVRHALPLLGIKKKRKLSPETIKKLSAHLATLRKAS